MINTNGFNSARPDSITKQDALVKVFEEFSVCGTLWLQRIIDLLMNGWKVTFYLFYYLVILHSHTGHTVREMVE